MVMEEQKGVRHEVVETGRATASSMFQRFRPPGYSKKTAASNAAAHTVYSYTIHSRSRSSNGKGLYLMRNASCLGRVYYYATHYIEICYVVSSNSGSKLKPLTTTIVFQWHDSCSSFL
jgi:hypothetical protein